jgi:hypothetical protein
MPEQLSSLIRVPQFRSMESYMPRFVLNLWICLFFLTSLSLGQIVVNPGNGTGGLANAVGPVFNITTYGCKADDSTDNAACFASAAAAVNAYSGPGIPTLTCDMGPGDIAYKSTGAIAFTKPATLKGSCTIDYTGSGDVVTLGPTGMVGFLTAQYKPYTVEGITFVGGASMTYGIHVPVWVPQTKIIDNTFFNFGASSNWMVHLDGGNAEIEISRNIVFANDSVAGRNAFYSFDSTASGSNTLRFVDNHVSNSSLACGGVGLYHGGYDSLITGNTFFSYSPSIHLSTTDRGNSSEAGLVVSKNSFDDQGCTNAATAGVIQVGDASSTNSTGAMFFLNNNTASDSSGNLNFVNLFPGTTSTTINANFQSNRALTSGGTGFLVKTSGSFICSCFGYDNGGWINGNTFGAFASGSAALPSLSVGQSTTGFHGGNSNNPVDFSFNGTDASEFGANYIWVKNAIGYAIGASSNSWLSAPSSGNFTLGTAAQSATGGHLTTTSYQIPLTATAALTAGQVVKIDTANPSAVLVAATTDTAAGIPVGIVINSPTIGTTANVVTNGIVTTPVLGTGTCTVGQFVIVDTTTNGRVKCTSTYTAGTIIGYAVTAQASVGSAVSVMVQIK